MHEIYELKEMLMKELEEYGKKGEMSAGSLEIVDKLAHAIKNLCKIIETAEEEGYSERGRSYTGGSYARGGRNGNYEGGSYARGRGRNARRDSMGRYSREGGYSRGGDMEELVENVRDIMQELPESVKHDAQRFVQKLEQEMM